MGYGAGYDEGYLEGYRKGLKERPGSPVVPQADTDVEATVTVLGPEMTTESFDFRVIVDGIAIGPESVTVLKAATDGSPAATSMVDTDGDDVLHGVFAKLTRLLTISLPGLDVGFTKLGFATEVFPASTYVAAVKDYGDSESVLNEWANCFVTGDREYTPFDSLTLLIGGDTFNFPLG